MPAAMHEIKQFYVEIEQEFLVFFTALQQQSKFELDKLKNEFHYTT